MATASHRARRLPHAVVAAIEASKILGIRAGTRSAHRFTGVWPVVVEGRVFVRSWTLKPDGWYRTLRDDPLATIQVGERELRVRALHPRSARVLDTIEREYARKYPTPGSRKYVRGFKLPNRRAATIEFVPR